MRGDFASKLLIQDKTLFMSPNILFLLHSHEDLGQIPIEGNDGLLDELPKNDPAWRESVEERAMKYNQEIEKKRKKEHSDVPELLVTLKKTRRGPSAVRETSSSSHETSLDGIEEERDAALKQLSVFRCQLLCSERCHPPRSPESDPTEQSCTGINCPRENLSLQELTSWKGLDKGITPLIIAICQGDLEIVQHIVEVWKVDIRATVDKYILHGFVFGECCHSYIFKGVTPLFVAALIKKSKIVRYLVENGADVSSRTSDDLGQTFSLTGLTPLHAALFLNLNQPVWESEQLDIIRCLVEYGADPSALSSNGVPIWKMGWVPFHEVNTCHRDCYSSRYRFCSPKATRLLIELGMSLVQQSSHLKRTVLHHLVADRHEDVEFLQFLLEKGADLQARDVNGLTPIMAAALGSNPNLFGHSIPNIILLNHLLEIEDISILEKINALEVAAACLLCYEHPTHDPFELLARAKDLRHRANCPLILKITVNGHAAEWITSLYNQPGIQQRSSEFHIQSALIRFRILSTISWGAVNEHAWLCFHASIGDCKNNILTPVYGSWQDRASWQPSPSALAACLGLLWTTLETFRHFDPNEEGLRSSTKRVAEELIRVLDVTSNNSLFNADSIKMSLKLISATYHICSIRAGVDYLSNQLILRLLSKLTLTEMMDQSIINDIHHIVSQNERDYDGGEYLIHTACLDAYTTLSTFRLLLRAGANPNATDREGNGALHHLAAWREKMDDHQGTDSTALLLLHYGANLNSRNNDGMTAADVWYAEAEEYNLELEEDVVDLNDPPDWLREKVLDLSSFCARVINRYKVPHNRLPKKLQDFIHGYFD